MATYQETLYATDSYTEDINTGAISRGSTLQASSVYNFNLSTTPYTFPTGKMIKIKFPEGTGYRKKRLIDTEKMAYISQKSGTASGSRPSGSAFLYVVNGDVSPDWETNAPYVNWNEYAVVNQYNSGIIDPYWGLPPGMDYIAVGCCTTGGIYNNVTYTANVSLAIHSHTGTNKPYVRYTYEDVVVTSRNQYPTSGFINEHADVKFGWSMTYDSYRVAETLTQQSAKFRWRVLGEAGYTEILVDGADKSITIPAGTFPAGESSVQWQVVLTSSDGIEGTPSAWFTLSLADSLSAPVTVSPKSAYIDGSIGNRFEWQHNIATGTAQTAYDLQYSADSGVTWEALAYGTTADQYADIPANTFPAGAVSWRVRTYNTDGNAGDWSEPAEIAVRAAPPAPSISNVTSTPRPTIAWQSAEQQAYQVKVSGGYDSGPVYGIAKQYKIKDFLVPGDYTISIRVQNLFGLWSEWATADITVSNLSAALRLSAKRANNGITLICAGGTFSRYLYYRNGEQIADTAAASFTDYLSNGKNTYQARGVNGDNYTLSPIAVEISTPDAAVISAADNVDWVPLNYRRGGYATHDVSDEQTVSYQHYSGSSLPVAEIGEAVSIVHELSFSVDAQTALKLRALRAKRVVYKDLCGVLAVGIFNGYKQSRGAYRPSTGSFDLDVSFTITETRG